MRRPDDSALARAYVAAARLWLAGLMAALLMAIGLSIAKGPPGMVAGAVLVALAKAFKPSAPDDLIDRINQRPPD